MANLKSIKQILFNTILLNWAFHLTLLFAVPSVGLAQKYRDTAIIFKVLPAFFYSNYYLKNNFGLPKLQEPGQKTFQLFSGSSFMGRDEILVKLKDPEIFTLMSNFFSLEDKYLELSNAKSDTRYFYVYLTPETIDSLSRLDSSIVCKNSYLDVGDQFCSISRKSKFYYFAKDAIRHNRLTQKQVRYSFDLVFKKPKKLEDYYTYYPEEDEGPVGDDNGDHKFSDIEYQRFQKERDRADQRSAELGVERKPAGLRALSKDSLNLLVDKVDEIIHTYKYFVKQFLTGIVMLRALPDTLTFTDVVTYYTLDNLPKKVKNVAQNYIEFDSRCRIFKAVLNNRSINLDSSADLRRLQIVQSDYEKLYPDLDAIKVVYVNPALISVNPWKPTFLEIQPKTGGLKDSIVRDEFSKRSTLIDDINSLNYTDPNLQKFDMPMLLKRLNESTVRENFALLDSTYKSKIHTISLDYDFFKSGKLWAQTDVVHQIIYLSPFLIRAAFINALENFNLFHLAYEQRDLKNFLDAKGQYISGKAIDNLYNDRVYTDYINAIKFVTGHEIAHIYLKDIPARDKEGLCDCYALYHLKKENKDIDFGVFETLLIRSVNENAVRFWGNGIKNEDVIIRYEFLRANKKAGVPLDIKKCDRLFR